MMSAVVRLVSAATRRRESTIVSTSINDLDFTALAARTSASVSRSVMALGALAAVEGLAADALVEIAARAGSGCADALGAAAAGVASVDTGAASTGALGE
jgi:hypothetical protein